MSDLDQTKEIQAQPTQDFPVRVYEEPPLPTAVRQAPTVASPIRSGRMETAEAVSSAAMYREAERVYNEFMRDQTVRSYSVESVRRFVLIETQQADNVATVDEQRQIAATSVLLVNKRTDAVLAYAIVSDDENSPSRADGELTALMRARQGSGRFVRRFKGVFAVQEALNLKRWIDGEIRATTCSYEVQKLVDMYMDKA